MKHRITEREKRRLLYSLFPDDGPLRRKLYHRHLLFFKLGADHKTRCFMAANRTGKTVGGGYELTLHLTGRYPDWWEGYRFDRPIDAWVAGDTKETVRDIIQKKLLGPQEEFGTGLIPAALMNAPVLRQNGGGAVDYVLIKHDSGGKSRLGFKSYDQGRTSFQGTEKDLVWLDEEANEGIRAECIIRLMTTKGLLIETFTPLKGITPIVSRYMQDSKIDGARVIISEEAAMVMAGWNDVPHLSEEEKKRMLAEAEPHLKRSRSEGIPSLGQGAIYPVQEEDIVCDPFEIPPHWPRVYALDVGWKRTAAVWGALDRDTDTVYLYDEYYRGQAEPAIHAEAVKQRGQWMCGVIDPASRGRNQKDGDQLFRIYTSMGLDLAMAKNAVESGIYDVWQRLSTGRIKVFNTLQNWLMEYRIYRRNENGKLVKENDHLMDATRYLIASGLAIASTEPNEDYGEEQEYLFDNKNEVCGY